MARRNQNAFIKRQKEIKRLKKAREKMARRHGKKLEDTRTFEGPHPDSLSPPERENVPDTIPEGKIESGA